MTEPPFYDQGGWSGPAPEFIVNDTGEPIRVKTQEELRSELAQPDWSAARNMLDALERGDLPPHHEEEEAIGIYLDDGSCIFRICSDGTVEAPDMERLDEAAVIFFKQVLRVAKLQGFKVAENPEGWDA